MLVYEYKLELKHHSILVLIPLNYHKSGLCFTGYPQQENVNKILNTYIQYFIHKI